MKKIAIIGSGISGLGAAYYLRKYYDLYLFEKESYVGGHANTITIQDDNTQLAIDTGFVVFNKTTYPRLVSLFAELQVAIQKSNMSFSMYNINSNLQFSGKSLYHLFAQGRNFLRSKHWSLLGQIHTFYKQSPRDLLEDLGDISLGNYLRQKGYGKYFTFNFILPMGSAIWSMPIEDVLDFPAKSFIRFFYNHGLLNINKNLQWWTLAGGSKNYIQQIRNHLKHDVFVNEEVMRVERQKDMKEVRVKTERSEYRFDYVIMATHANTSLAILHNPNTLEDETLCTYKYTKNRAILHTDRRVMPPLHSIWSSWNYKARCKEGRLQTSTVYHMNSLQNLKTQKDYFVSINDFETIDPNKILYTTEYEHPLFNGPAIKRQPNLNRLNVSGPVYFAGAYFGNGFHEDGLVAAWDVSRRLINAL